LNTHIDANAKIVAEVVEVPRFLARAWVCNPKSYTMKRINNKDTEPLSSKTSVVLKSIGKSRGRKYGC
jgi:hypothetical protein